MEDIALRLFRLADLEHKGFIGKRDMQRLQSEVGLLPEQLETVFESLDACNNGYLTLDQFIAGINNFTNSFYATDIQPLDMSTSVVIHRTNSMDEQEMILHKLLNLKVLLKTSDSLEDVFKKIQNNANEQLKQAWSLFLSNLCVDVSQLHKQLVELEERLRQREQQHEIQMGKLFEELESQVCDEREKISKEGKKIEALLRAQLSSELREKDQQITDLIEQRNELIEQMSFLQSREIATKEKNTKLLKGQESFDSEIENQKQSISELKYTLEKSKREAAIEKEKSFQEGFRHAQKMAIIEEEGLVQQLRLIKEMQETLLSGIKLEKRKKN